METNKRFQNSLLVKVLEFLFILSSLPCSLEKESERMGGGHGEKGQREGISNILPTELRAHRGA